MWARRAVIWHGILAAYLWAISWFPLGNWNRQQDEPLLPQLLKDKGLHPDDLFTLAFVTAPLILFWLAWRFRTRWLALCGLVVDVAWMWMQMQSWWIPYVFGARAAWQIRYAQGPTTKVLPSFGNHVAPDGMHLTIHVLLVIAFLCGIAALREMRTLISSEKVPPCHPE
jgi:hypothetical protein